MLRIFLTLFLSLILLSGCESLSSLRETIRAQFSKTKENVVKTTETVKKKIDDVHSAAKEIEDAATQVNEAVKAIKSIGGQTPPPPVTPPPPTKKRGPTLEDASPKN